MKLRAWLYLGLAVLFGCADGDTGGGPLPSPPPTATPVPTVRPPPMLYPTGVVTDDAALAHTQGIYSIPANGGEQCCWLSDRVEFEVRAPARTRSLRLTLVQLPTPAVRRTPQTVSVLGSGDRVIAVRPIRLGGNEVSIPLPRAAPGGKTVVSLLFHSSFVPSIEHTGADGRRLSLILTGVATVGGAGH